MRRVDQGRIGIKEPMERQEWRSFPGREAGGFWQQESNKVYGTEGQYTLSG